MKLVILYRINIILWNKTLKGQQKKDVCSDIAQELHINKVEVQRKIKNLSTRLRWRNNLDFINCSFFKSHIVV